MADQPENWLEKYLRELGVEQEAPAARLAAIDLVERARESRMQLLEQLADLTRRVEKLEQGNDAPRV